MPNYRMAFPGKYLKAADLGSTRPTVTIARVRLEDVGIGTQSPEQKLVVHFSEADNLRPLIVNLTNADTIAELTGTDDYNAWVGCRLELFVTTTTYQGKRVPGIRIGAPPVTSPRSGTLPTTHHTTADELDDAIPEGF